MYTHIEIYSKRNLTHDSDTIEAFLAVFSAYERLEKPTYHLGEFRSSTEYLAEQKSHPFPTPREQNSFCVGSSSKVLLELKAGKTFPVGHGQAGLDPQHFPRKVLTF